MQSSRVLALLDARTRSVHEFADADRLAVLAPGVTLDGYRAFLSRIYGFEAPLEAAFQMTVGLAEIIDLRSRSHVRLLRTDLGALGIREPSMLPACAAVFPFRNPADALGWMYAVDRNLALGGSLRRYLEPKLPFVPRSYLSAGERATVARMRELGAALDAIASALPSPDRIVEAALAAFRCQREWFTPRACARVA